MASEEDELQDLPAKASTLTLAYGGHNEEVLNKAKNLLASATEHAIRQEPPDCPNLNYAPQLGSARFRTTLAGFLSRRYRREVKCDRLVLTCGATHALHLVTTQFFDTGSLVFVEDPSYYLALGLLRDDLRMRIVPVPMEEDGMALDVLEERLSTLRDECSFTPTRSQPFWSMVYTIPDHHNPTGTAMSPVKRRRLVELAHRFDLLVFCDDVYNLLTYQPAAVGPLLLTFDAVEPDQPGHVVSAGTFSKICAPGVRVGWLEAPPRVVDVLYGSKILFSGGAVNSFMSSVMASSIELGLLDRHLDSIADQLQEKMRLAVSLLEEALPAGRYRLRPPDGGFFLWLRCPFEAAPFAAWSAGRRAVAVRAGSACSAGGAGGRHLRLSVSYLDAGRLGEALQRLCDALLEYETGLPAA